MVPDLLYELSMLPRYLTALPVFDEVQHVDSVLDEVLRYSREVLAVDDGSTDGTAERLARRTDIRLVTHEKNQGYGAALMSAFVYAAQHDFEVLVTVDCDGQHEPQRIPQFVDACQNADLVSGSRYLEPYNGDGQPPEDRRQINQQVTAELNRRLGSSLTDAFCGFKAYRVKALRSLNLTERGYAMPLELWAQAAAAELNVVELPVPLIYLDESRSFGGMLDDAQTRMDYYHTVIDRSIVAARTETPLCSKGDPCGNLVR